MILKDVIKNLKETVSERDFSFLALTLSVALLPLSINLSTFTFILSLALKLIQIVLKKSQFFATKALKHSALIGLIFFLYIELNSIIQTSVSYHILHFEREYMHFALFFLTPMLLKRKGQNKILLQALFIGLACNIGFIFIKGLILNMSFNKHPFAKVFDIHHTYLATFILTYVNYCLVQVITNKKVSNLALKSLCVLLCLVSLYVLFMLESKIGMFVFLVLFLIHSLPKLSRINVWYYVSFLLVILICLSAFISRVTVNYERALDFRLQIWEVSFKVFEEHFWFGNSKQPEKEILNYNHFLNGKYYFLDSDLNSHNQYLSVLMRFGAIGFLILLMYGINVFKKINPKTTKPLFMEFLGFLVIAVFVCYIENIFDRHHGILYLSVFYNYYLVAVEND